MNTKFISNRNYVLRKVLNSEKSIDIVKDFIETILDINIENIELNPYLKQKEKYLPREENFGIVDVRVKTDKDEEINVGIQFIDGIYIQTKMLMYYAQIHLNQLEYNNEREFAKTVTINILDFSYFSSQDYLNTIKIKSNDIYVNIEELEFLVLELSKFIYKNDMSKREQWIMYLKGCNIDILQEIKSQNDNIKLLDELIDEYWNKETME